MNDALMLTIETYLGFAIIIFIIALILIWLFLRSAIKSGVEGAIISDWYKQIIYNETKTAILDALEKSNIKKTKENLFEQSENKP